MSHKKVIKILRKWKQSFRNFPFSYAAFLLAIYRKTPVMASQDKTSGKEADKPEKVGGKDCFLKEIFLRNIFLSKIFLLIFLRQMFRISFLKNVLKILQEKNLKTIFLKPFLILKTPGKTNTTA